MKSIIGNNIFVIVKIDNIIFSLEIRKKTNYIGNDCLINKAW